MNYPDLELRHELATLPGCRIGVALTGGMALVDIARAVHLCPAAQLVLLAALTAACCLRQGWVSSLAVASTSWLVATGFVVNAYGQLTWTGAADAVRLSIFVLAAAVGGGVR